MDNDKNIGESIEGLGGVLPDGRTVDLIKDELTGKLKLLCFDGTQYRTEDRISIKGRTFVPPALDPAIQRALTFPANVAAYGCTKDLFDSMRKVFVKYGMSPVAITVTYFVFLAWFPSLPAPCLIITGPGPEAAVLLQLLPCMVRCSLLVAGIDSPGFRGLVQNVHPTVLMDASYFTPRSLHKLLASCGSPCFAPWKGSVAKSSFAKIIYAGVALSEDVPTGYALRVHLSPSPRGVSLLDEENRDQIITADLQSKLLDYRLRNLAKIRASTFDLPELDLESRTVGRSLGRSIVDDPELQGGVRPLLEHRDDELRSARWTDPTCAIIEAMLDKSHSPQPDGIYVGKVAEAANALLQARGAGVQLKPRSVGSTLRQLGITPKPNSKGNRVLLTNKVIQAIHGLARDHRVAAVEHGIARCAMCRETFTGHTEPHGESS